MRNCELCKEAEPNTAAACRVRNAVSVYLGCFSLGLLKGSDACALLCHQLTGLSRLPLRLLQLPSKRHILHRHLLLLLPCNRKLQRQV